MGRPLVKEMQENVVLTSTHSWLEGRTPDLQWDTADDFQRSCQELLCASPAMLRMLVEDLSEKSLLRLFRKSEILKTRSKMKADRVSVIIKGSLQRFLSLLNNARNRNKLSRPIVAEWFHTQLLALRDEEENQKPGLWPTLWQRQQQDSGWKAALFAALSSSPECDAMPSYLRARFLHTLERYEEATLPSAHMDQWRRWYSGSLLTWKLHRFSEFLREKQHALHSLLSSSAVPPPDQAQASSDSAPVPNQDSSRNENTWEGLSEQLAEWGSRRTLLEQAQALETEIMEAAQREWADLTCLFHSLQWPTEELPEEGSIVQQMNAALALCEQRLPALREQIEQDPDHQRLERMMSLQERLIPTPGRGDQLLLSEEAAQLRMAAPWPPQPFALLEVAPLLHSLSVVVEEPEKPEHRRHWDRIEEELSYRFVEGFRKNLLVPGRARLRSPAPSSTREQALQSIASDKKEDPEPPPPKEAPSRVPVLQPIASDKNEAPEPAPPEGARFREVTPATSPLEPVQQGSTDPGEDTTTDSHPTTVLETANDEQKSADPPSSEESVATLVDESPQPLSPFAHDSAPMSPEEPERLPPSREVPASKESLSVPLQTPGPPLMAASDQRLQADLASLLSKSRGKLSRDARDAFVEQQQRWLSKGHLLPASVLAEVYEDKVDEWGEDLTAGYIPAWLCLVAQSIHEPQARFLEVTGLGFVSQWYSLQEDSPCPTKFLLRWLGLGLLSEDLTAFQLCSAFPSSNWDKILPAGNELDKFLLSKLVLPAQNGMRPEIATQERPESLQNLFEAELEAARQIVEPARLHNFHKTIVKQYWRTLTQPHGVTHQLLAAVEAGETPELLHLTPEQLAKRVDGWSKIIAQYKNNILSRLNSFLLRLREANKHHKAKVARLQLAPNTLTSQELGTAAALADDLLEPNTPEARSLRFVTRELHQKLVTLSLPESNE